MGVNHCDALAYAARTLGYRREDLKGDPYDADERAPWMRIATYAALDFPTLGQRKNVLDLLARETTP